MIEIDLRIKKFIAEHNVMTLATIDADGVCRCCSIFYVYIEEINRFVFTSSKETAHGAAMSQNGRVAANILLETTIVGKIEGLQIEGVAELANGEIKDKAKKSYLKKYPYAIFMDIELWTLEPTFLKYTDNKLGFGKKLIWDGANRS